MKKGLKVFLIVAGILAVLFLAAVGIGGWLVYNSVVNAADGAFPQVNAFLRDVEGDVTYSRNDGSFVATNYLALEEGDILNTGDNSSAAIYWSGYGRTLLEENTEVLISAAERPGKNKIRARLKLEGGRTWTRIEKLLGVDSDIMIQSSDVVATVRGTSFGMDNLGEDVQVRVLESKVAIGSGNGDLSSDNFDFTEALKVNVGSKILNQNNQFGSLEALSQNDLQDPLLIEGNAPIPPEDLLGCSELNPYEFWTWLVKSIQYIQSNPVVLDTANGQESFIMWLPNRYRLCARTILNS